MTTPLLEVDDLAVSFPLKRSSLRLHAPRLHAVAGVSFSVRAGETVGLVGESGSGKSTIARAIVGLEQVTGGDIRFDGESLLTMSRGRRREVGRQIQMVFQDPYSSLHPRMTVLDAICEGWRHNPGIVPRQQWKPRALEIMERVGLSPDHASRLPGQFSGGQRQRIGIARALALEPRMIVFDEPVSALDVSIQAQILNLLADLQRDLGLTSLFIAHDLAVVRHISDDINVMYLGKLAETGPAEAVFGDPRHPYTRALLSAVPQITVNPSARPDGTRGLSGEIPSPADPPSGCRFRTRCPLAQPQCAEVVPGFVDLGDRHRAACHLVVA
ncbi:ABC transporter ATP-binding protein [Agromyces aerolatus]|uniref:ABC transporter ATP-binding protein n=1 Tax=Agromyces sp. LY-1074 TaxID=3074080 RepID=UPI0028614A71|nr:MULTISPECIES: oligopeptide/dipeptide ABC transporter ATP-binding protein [unclassified Agromyces]MDR5701200.1 ATP-binding cassette domain-containing protein [Agromyces sp. LY-1074]MDR5706924.1 ATP-binding cassette domain-containing protein [Agromyces sp. LY-1358]